MTANSPVGKYLSKRGYTGAIPATIGYLPPRDLHAAAMIVAFGLASENEPGVLAAPTNITGVHITKLTPDGDKAPDSRGKAKRMLGTCKGKPIVIAPPNDLLGLAIVEGIEDGLSVYQSTGLGVWVAGCASFMPALAPVVPDWINSVTIFTHTDDVGRKYSNELAEALTLRGFDDVRMDGSAS
jgi:hypothetical protein